MAIGLRGYSSSPVVTTKLFGFLLLITLLSTALAFALAVPDEALEEAEAPGPTPLMEDGLPATDLRYDIEASVEPSTGELSGTVTVEWTYPGTDPLTEVPIHLYLNGFSNMDSTWVAGSSALRDFDLEEKAETFGDPWGHSELIAVRQGSETCETRFVQPDDGNPHDRSLAMVTLAEPLAPGATLKLTMEFDAQLPVPIARTGCHRVRQYCHVGQWFPKLSVFDAEGRSGEQGFVAHQFHGPTEFFAPFADYRVSIDIPAGFDLVATGRREGVKEDGERQQVVYAQRAVHDFAFVVAPELVIDESTHQPTGGGPEVLLTMVTQPETPLHVQGMRDATALSLDVLSTDVGPYAWDAMTVVEPPLAAAQTAGMEYQTLVTGMVADPAADLLSLDATGLTTIVIFHEVAHNWFQGMLASDEVSDAHLDEGMTSYWEGRIRQVWEERHGKFHYLGLTSDPVHARRGSSRRPQSVPQSQLTRPSWLLARRTHGSQIYARIPMLFSTVARKYGTDEVDTFFQAWYARWRFGHPRSEDLLQMVRDETAGPVRRFMVQALLEPEIPDYAIEKASSTPWQTPLGRVMGEEGPVVVTAENQEAHTDDLLGLAPSALEPDGKVAVEVRYPGSVDDGDIASGQVERQLWTPTEIRDPEETDESDEEQADEEEDGDKYWVSAVRVSGPAWEHLPITIRFEFDDGVVLDLEWDARTPWRTYRFLRPAKLASVHLDPELTLILEGPVGNNAELLTPDDEPLRPMVWWFTRVAQWAMVNVGMWL